MLNKILTNKLLPIISFAITIIFFCTFILVMDRMDSLFFHVMLGLLLLTLVVLPFYCTILSLIFLIKKKYSPFSIIGFLLNFIWLALLIILSVIDL